MLPSNCTSRKKRAWSLRPAKLILESKDEMPKIPVGHIRTEPLVTEWNNSHVLHFHRLFQWQVM